jgi:predicted RNA-binding protein with PIN domain
MKKTLIIDAYNVIHSWKNKSLAEPALAGADEFLGAVGPYADAYDGKVTVVFDGESGKRESLKARHRNVDIVFSSAEATADSVIEKMVQGRQEDESMTVVTSDRMIVHIASGAGAAIISPEMFHGILEESGKKVKRKLRSSSSGQRGFSIEDIIDKNDF